MSVKKPHIKRYLKHPIARDLRDKMIFISGPRQAGKTTLALSFLKKPRASHPAYLNYDHPDDQDMIIKGLFPPGQKTIVLDEVHKYPRWRNLIKGFYDKKNLTSGF